MDLMDKNGKPVTNKVLEDKFELESSAVSWILLEMHALKLITSSMDENDWVIEQQEGHQINRYHATEKGRKEGGKLGTVRFVLTELPALAKLGLEVLNDVTASAEARSKSIEDLQKDDPEELAELVALRKQKILNDFSSDDLRQLQKDINEIKRKKS